MMRGITGKWLLSVVVTMTIGLLLLGTASYQVVTGHFASFVGKNLEDRTRTYASLLSEDFSQQTLEHIRRMERGSGRWVYLFQPSGQLYDGSEQKDTALIDAVRGRLQDREGTQRHRLTLPGSQRPALMVASPFAPSGKEAGTVVVILEMSWLTATFRSLEALILLAGVGALSIGGGIALLLSRRTVRPILDIRNAAVQLAHGDYRTRIPVRGNDELTSLGERMNELAQSLDYYRSSRRTFLSEISHELRTPLSYLKGYTALLEERDLSEQKSRRLKRVIREQTDRLERLVEDLVTLSRLDEGKLELNKERISPTRRIQKVIRELEPHAEKKGVQLRWSGRVNEGLWFDPVRFDQILINLLDNAIHHSEAGSEVEVTLSPSPEANWIRIEVKDRGVGMEAEELERIWERFYRVEKSRSREHGGSGLGLSIVQRLVNLHQGSIEVKSQPGEGTIFVMEFPVAASGGIRGGRSC
ncbi:sensor histidine kinase [Paludifilum halophilum]|nr:HAMP domain-containing sensor histidine kinase [Paludifilum halophilum]